jgi:sterol 3beta-glucosyltransferase
MRAILTNFGTLGDVQPFLALAVELRRHGHTPVLAMPPGFRSLIEPHGLEYVPIGPDLRREQGDITQSMMATPGVLDSAAQMGQMFGPLAAALPRMLEDLRAVSQGADVLISGRMQPAARMIHDLTHIPLATIHVEHSGSGGGSPAFQAAVRAIINPLRESLGLPAFENPLVDGNSPQLVLHALSRHVRQPPPDWPAHWHMTGYFFLDAPGFEPDPELARFMAEGEAPVVVTFGSMTHEDPAALTELLVEGLRRAGRRALIQHGWSGMARHPMPPGMRALDFVPHAWLFPRAACVIHHGGAGTTGAAFRAGVPQVVVPHSYDQFFWGEIAQELGCSGPAVPIQELTAERLAEAVDALLSTPRHGRTAAALGEAIRAEHGVVKARKLIEDLVERVGLSSMPREPDEQDADEPGSRQERRKALSQRQRGRKHDDDV